MNKRTRIKTGTLVASTCRKTYMLCKDKIILVKYKENIFGNIILQKIPL